LATSSAFAYNVRGEGDEWLGERFPTKDERSIQSYEGDKCTPALKDRNWRHCAFVPESGGEGESAGGSSDGGDQSN
jgi:hypothetical protein